jgi:hypothetical protein
MNFSTETLMAYADDELDAQTRVAVEQAMQQDPQIAQVVANHRKQRALLQAAFAGELGGPVPDRLLSAAQTAPAGEDPGVAGIGAARATRNATARARWSWPEWGAVAASAVLGVLVGRSALLSQADEPWLARDGRIPAESLLGAALSNQPGGALEQGSPVVIGLSYEARSGQYCRTFALQETQPLAGVACRDPQGWRIQALAPSESSGTGNYRLADSTLPSIILQLVEQEIEGEPLDADAEARAQARDWRAP